MKVGNVRLEDTLSQKSNFSITESLNCNKDYKLGETLSQVMKPLQQVVFEP